MKARVKEDRFPIPVLLPAVAFQRIRQEAKRRKVSVKRIVQEVVSAMAAENYQHTGRDLRLEKYGFSYDNVDWDNDEEGNGVIVAEYVMERLPPSLKELQ